MTLDFEQIGAHISDYIKKGNFFDSYDIGDIKTIMKYSHLTANEYCDLLKQSHSTINARKLYMSTRKASVTVQNLEEVVSVLNSVKKYMKFHIFDGIIDFLNQGQIQNQPQMPIVPIPRVNRNYNFPMILMMFTNSLMKSLR